MQVPIPLINASCMAAAAEPLSLTTHPILFITHPHNVPPSHLYQSAKDKPVTSLHETIPCARQPHYGATTFNPTPLLASREKGLALHIYLSTSHMVTSYKQHTHFPSLAAPTGVQPETADIMCMPVRNCRATKDRHSSHVTNILHITV